MTMCHRAKSIKIDIVKVHRTGHRNRNSYLANVKTRWVPGVPNFTDFKFRIPESSRVYAIL